MVKNVEGFRAELKNAAFGYLEVLQNTHIKIYTVWVIKKVAARVSERQPTGSNKLIWVPQQRTKAFRVESFIRPRRGTGCQIRIGTCSDTIRGSGVVENRYPVRAATIDHAKRNAGLKDSDPGKLPALT